MNENPLRRLPAVNLVFGEPAIQALNGEFAHEFILALIREEIEIVRDRLKHTQAGNDSPSAEAIARTVAERIQAAAKPRLRPVINATGIVLHTNLGRSPIAEVAANAAYEAAHAYLNLELDLATGKRSSRQDPIRELISQLTGAESATVVNNCAAATVIALRALAQGKEVIVSRGQLIEIGGNFRIPEIMAVSGAILREVGTTNITRIGDYERAIGPNTGLLMRIHASNFRIRGFTEEAALAELVALGRKHNLPVIDDAGSGAMLDFAGYGLVGEPIVPRSVAAGADLVLFSGDKLLGGPQAGIIAGKKNLIERIDKDPLMRAFRLDKMSLAALEATLQLYRHPEKSLREIPTLRMLTAKPEDLHRRAEALATKLQMVSGIVKVEVRNETTFAGGGSLPDQPLPAPVIAVLVKDISDAIFGERLRLGNPAVMARMRDGQVLFDLRTVFENQEAELLQAIQTACN